MGMTRIERGTRSELARFLRSQGYVTYAKLLLGFDLNFYRPPKGVFAAKMEPGKNRIIINPTITDKEALSVLIRHEILHEYLKHEDRLLKHLAKENGLDYDKLDDLSLRQLKNTLYSIKNKKAFNYAADYEISNRGYTENDKEIVRDLGPYLNVTNKIIGLVTEDDHPEWVNLPVEVMYDKLIDAKKKAQEEAEKKLEDENIVEGVFINDRAFYDSHKNVIYGVGGGAIIG